jgi:hypothetical protein
MQKPRQAASPMAAPVVGEISELLRRQPRATRLTATVGLGRIPRNLFLVFTALLVLFIPGYDFGQREHWMVQLQRPTGRPL